MNYIDKIIETFGEEDLKRRFDDDLKDFHFEAFFSIIVLNYCYDLELECTYVQRRKLFMELVEYFMRAKLLKFQKSKITLIDWYKEIPKGGDVKESFTEIYWDGDNATVEKTLSFLETHMPKGDEINTWEGETEFNEDARMTEFFYIVCPLASYWFDGDEEYPPEWIHTS
jgi:hypothetical protein